MREPLTPGGNGSSGGSFAVVPQRLTTRSKIAFAVGGCPAQVSGTIIGFFVNPWLLDVVGMRAVNVSYILLVGRVCDAFSDPLVGWLSDRTQSRCALPPLRCLSCRSHWARHRSTVAARLTMRSRGCASPAAWGGGGRGSSQGCCRAQSRTRRSSSPRSSSALSSTRKARCVSLPHLHPPSSPAFLPRARSLSRRCVSPFNQVAVDIACVPPRSSH